MKTSPHISLCELNINGLGGNGKREEIRPWLRRAADLVVLTDTRIRADHNFWTEVRPKGFIAASPSERASGVAVLCFKEGLTLAGAAVHPSGRLVSVQVQWGTQSFTLIAVYLPAQVDRRAHFVRDVLQPAVAGVAAGSDLIIAGDLNIVEDPELDRASRLGSAGENRRLISCCGSFDMRDAFRELNPRKREFTFGAGTVGSRIDRVLVSQSLLYRVSDASHKALPFGTSDHSFAIRTVLRADIQDAAGPGIWRLQAKMVGRQGVRKIVEAVTARHLGSGSRGLDLLLEKQRAGLRPHIKEERRRVAATAVHLEEAVAGLRQRIMGGDRDAATKADGIKQEAALIAYKDSCRERLKVMAGMRLELEGEVPSSFLLAKIKARRAGTTIAELTWNGRSLTQPGDILNAASEFYGSLFRRDASLVAAEWVPKAEKVLSAAEAERLSAPWSEAEVLEAIRGLASGKSPGQDGLPKEFIEKHWDLLSGEFMAMVGEFGRTGSLSAHTQEAVMVLLYKKGAADDIRNYRPISLLCSTYKIIAKVLANRMKAAIAKVISQEQFGFIPGRRLSDAVALVADIIDAGNAGREDWFLLLVDFQKAFDSVGRDYLFGVLRVMGFPETYVRWVQGLHAEASTKICMNGWLGDPIRMEKGVRQGCPLAPYLFLCAVEPLCQAAVARSLGLRRKGCGRLAYLGYPDDTTLVLNGRLQLLKADQLLKDFEGWSGLKTNRDKSVVIPLGKNRDKAAPDALGYKWAGSGDAERLLGIWVNSAGDPAPSWDRALERTQAELGKWHGNYLSTTARVAVVNSYVMPMVTFQAQVYPPSPVAWKRFLQLTHSFVSSGKAVLGRTFTLWSKELLSLPRASGGLGVTDQTSRVGSLAVRSVAMLVRESNMVKREIMERAAAPPLGLASFYAHPELLKHWGSGSLRWRGIGRVFLEADSLTVAPADTKWDVEQEQVAFNRLILNQQGRPFGAQEASKGLWGWRIADLVEDKGDGSRAVKDAGTLAGELGSRKLAALALKAFEAAPPRWRELAHEPLTAGAVLAATSYIRTAPLRGREGSVWEILGSAGEILTCKPVTIGAGGIISRCGGTVSADLGVRTVIPLKEVGGRIIGELGAPSTRLALLTMGGGGEILKLCEMRKLLVKQAVGLQAKRASWEERWGRPIDWKGCVEVRDSIAIPGKARDVLLRIHCLNLQVGERLDFWGSRACCPYCGGEETLEHCLVECPTVRPVATALRRALHMLNPARKITSLGDMLFQQGSTKSGFPEATLTSIVLHRVWADRCGALFRGERFQVKRALRRIATAFLLHSKVVLRAAGVRRIGQARLLEADEDNTLHRILDTSLGKMTWSKAFQSIWANPRTFFKPP